MICFYKTARYVFHVLSGKSRRNDDRASHGADFLGVTNGFYRSVGDIREHLADDGRKRSAANESYRIGRFHLFRFAFQ